MNTFTDTDLTVLEGLDEAWPCEVATHPCENSAVVHVIASGRTCGCDLSKNLCAPCLSITLDIRNLEANWLLSCGHIDFGMHRQVVVIDRIEAL